MTDKQNFIKSYSRFKKYQEILPDYEDLTTSLKFISSKGPILSQVIEILNSLHIYQVSLIDREKHAFLSLPTQKKKNRTIIELMKKLRKTEETEAFYM